MRTTRGRRGAPKPCLVCGTVTLYTFCEAHAKERGRRSRVQARKALHRKKLMIRSGDRCEQCDWYDPTGRTLEVDHRIPLFMGGEDEFWNKWLLCIDCHRDKTVAEQQQGGHIGADRSKPVGNPMQR